VKYLKCRVEVLSKDEIYDIHVASLDVLEYAGATFHSKEALKIFEDYGAIVNYKKLNVKIPTYMVEELVRKAPKKYWLYGRTPKYDVEIGGKNQFLDQAGDFNYVIDMETGERRFGFLKDYENFVKIGDALENIPIPYGMVRYPYDVPENLQHVELWMTQYKNTPAPLPIFCENVDTTKDCLELAAVAAGGEEELRRKPCSFGSISADSPLQFDAKLTEGAIECARFGLPTTSGPMDITGATAPLTLAGTMVQTNATILAGISLVQIINPGTGVVYSDLPAVIDMRTGIASVGGPEQALLSVASAQMARYYRLPSSVWGGIPDSKVIDAQAGYESALTLVPTLLAGANQVVGGGLEYYFSACYEMVVIHNEIFGMAKRMVEGIEVNEDTLAVPIIKRIAPKAAARTGAHYLAEKHTLDHIDKELYIPKISDKTRRNMWEKAGSKDLSQVAKERVKEILAKHVPEPPPPDILKKLEKKAEEIKKRILKRKNACTCV
jgi:trimethylamine--corrinoid protein Co-methyltransferase